MTTCKPLSLPEESISVTFQSPDAIHQARPPRQQRAAFSESISSGAEGLTGTHTSDQLSEESLITSAMKKKKKTHSLEMNLIQKITLTSAQLASEPKSQRDSQKHT